jgi:hypothetical protein
MSWYLPPPIILSAQKPRIALPNLNFHHFPFSQIVPTTGLRVGVEILPQGYIHFLIPEKTEFGPKARLENIFSLFLSIKAIFLLLK